MESVPVVAVGVERRGVIGMLQLRSGDLPITMQAGDGEAAPMASATGLPARLPASGEPSASCGDEGRVMRTPGRGQNDGDGSSCR
uniref:Uncharacterized protein n=1 Tax=Oryza meridionalis TaxID=40149 RepID=A0A0E0DMI0_9ORYZ